MGHSWLEPVSCLRAAWPPCWPLSFVMVPEPVQPDGWATKMSCPSLALYTIANRVCGEGETATKRSLPKKHLGTYAPGCCNLHPWPSETMAKERRKLTMKSDIAVCGEVFLITSIQSPELPTWGLSEDSCTQLAFWVMRIMDFSFCSSCLELQLRQIVRLWQLNQPLHMAPLDRCLGLYFSLYLYCPESWVPSSTASSFDVMS